MSKLDAVWYGKLSGRFWRHPKALGLSAGAGWLWTRALSYVVDQRTDGVIATAALKALEPKHGARLAAELVAADLWETHPAGHVFHDFADHGMTVASWEEKKEEARERAARSRAKKAAGHASVTRDEDAPDAHETRTQVSADSGLRTQDSGVLRSSQEGDLDQAAREPAADVSAKLSPEGSAWVRAFGAEYERHTKALAPSIFGELPALIASGADPALACAGFFATKRHAKSRPPFQARFLAEDPGGYAACARPTNGASHPDEFVSSLSGRPTP